MTTPHEAEFIKIDNVTVTSQHLVAYIKYKVIIMTINGENYLTTVFVEFEFEEEIDDEMFSILEENTKSEFVNFKKKFN